MSDYMNDPRLPGYEEEPPKRRRFRLFDSQREGKGVSKEDAKITPDLGGFFRSLRRNFSKLLSVNLLTIAGNFPFLFIILALSGISKIEYMMPLSGYAGHFADLHTMMLLDPAWDPATMALFGSFGVQVPNAAPTGATYVLFALAALAFFTFGFTKVGTTYILRSMIRGEPTFMLADFRHAIKRNAKQAFFYGIADLFILAILPINVYLLLGTAGGFFDSVVLWINILLVVIYYFMRPYVYLQMITFDLPLGKIIKNALIFTLLGFKRNLLALVGFVLLVLLVLLFIFGIGGILLPIGLAIPLVLLFSLGSFMSAFAAWFKIRDVMVTDAEEASEDEA